MTSRGIVVFVDEDNAAFEPWTEELEFRGQKTRRLATGDVAFEALRTRTRDEIALVVIDVMLAVHDPTGEQFTVERTDSYLETGLCLLEDLVEVNPQTFPIRAVLLTNTVTDTTLKAAKAASDKYGVPLWRKSDISSPKDFADRVETQLERVSQRDDR